MRLHRSHGLGNDYLVLESGERMTAKLARELCDRHRGAGGDGVLEPTAARDADFGVRIWNPDGSVAEKSGNGLRIFARWLADRGAPRVFTVSTGPCVVRCEIGADIAIEMGRATVGGAEALDLGVRFHPVDVGNPHAVLFSDENPGVDFWAVARKIETHGRFPQRTNTQWATVSADRLSMLIWERGAGETSASGSSSCAVAAAAVATGRRPPGQIRVEMPGGVLTVEVSADLDLVLTGPVEPIGTITMDPRWVLSRTAEQ